MKRLHDKVAIVTGAGGGIGRETCLRFSEEGATVIALDWDSDAGKQTVYELKQTGGNGTFIQVDLTVEAEVRKSVASVFETYGRIDVLFNVAGMSGRRFGDGPVDRCTEEGWDRTMEINAKTTFLTCKHVVPLMVEQGRGSIINLSSVLGMVGGGELFATHAYAASKSAIIGLSRAMAVYYASKGIRVNVISPGLIETPMSVRAQASTEILQYMKQMQPITGGLGKPRAIADAAVYLASDESSFVTGVVLPVDGGWTAQ
jgi:NAD(P)-dependent dehydrogenase (short-subunit alcohol dehydrogenase family)